MINREQEDEMRYMFIRRTLYWVIAITIINLTYSKLYASTDVPLYSDLLSEKKAQMKKDVFLKKTVSSVNTLNTWSVYKGQTLDNVLAQWANFAGWDLVWDSRQTYKLRAAASFENIRFEQAVKELFDAVGNTDPRLYVTLYKKNKVILVSAKPEF